MTWEPVVKSSTGTRFLEPVLRVSQPRKPHSPHRNGCFSSQALSLFCGAEYGVLYKNNKGWAVRVFDREPKTPEEGGSFRHISEAGTISLLDIPPGRYVLRLLEDEDGLYFLEPRSRDEIMQGKKTTGTHRWKRS